MGTAHASPQACSLPYPNQAPLVHVGSGVWTEIPIPFGPGSIWFELWWEGRRTVSSCRSTQLDERLSGPAGLSLGAKGELAG